ncbi:MAG: hypothetical protein U9Q83_08540, partial [Bacteroidota bacterium]|nr:hypothetical protein [Bacteroidota bacterium]
MGKKNKEKKIKTEEIVETEKLETEVIVEKPKTYTQKLKDIQKDIDKMAQIEKDIIYTEKKLDNLFL